MTDVARQAERALQSNDQDELRRVLASIERARDPVPAIPTLLALTGCQFWSLRRQAASVLVRIGAPALPHIKPLLASGNADQLYWACYVLTQVEGRGAPLLGSVLHSRSKEIRLCAIQALARRPAVDAIDQLVHALDDPAWSNRKQAADVLAARADHDAVVDRVKDEITKGNRNRVYWGVHVLAQILGTRTMPILMKLMPWRDDDLRYLVLSALARLRVDGVLPLLVQHINDRSPLIRRNIADLLVGFGSEAQETLAELTRTGSPEARLLALRAMARIAPDAFVGCCRRMLSSDRTEDKYAAVQALGQAGTDEALAVLVSCFQDPQWVIRRYASEEIRLMGERAIPLLLETLRTGDEDVQFWSMLTLSRIGRSAWPHLKQAMIQADKAGRAFVLAALSEADLPSEFVALFARSFEDEHWPIRHQAAECVRSMGQRALPHLIKPAFARRDNTRF